MVPITHKKYKIKNLIQDKLIICNWLSLYFQLYTQKKNLCSTLTLMFRTMQNIPVLRMDKHLFVKLLYERLEYKEINAYS